MPLATVSLFAEAAGQTTPVLVGQAIADASGVWSITSIPLADGSYSFFVQVTDTAGHVGALNQILPGSGVGHLVIDTVGPKRDRLVFNPLQGQIQITFQDDRSGLDPAGLANLANYVLTNGSRPGQVFSVTSLSVTPAANRTDIQTVTLTFNNGQRLRGINYRLTIVAAGLKDVAGNGPGRDVLRILPLGRPPPRAATSWPCSTRSITPSSRPCRCRPRPSPSAAAPGPHECRWPSSAA